MKGKLGWTAERLFGRLMKLLNQFDTTLSLILALGGEAAADYTAPLFKHKTHVLEPRRTRRYCCTS